MAAAAVSAGTPNISTTVGFFGLTRRSHRRKLSSAAAEVSAEASAAADSHCRRASAAGSLRIFVVEAAVEAAAIGRRIFEVIIAGICWRNFALFGKHCSVAFADICHTAMVRLGNHILA